MPTKGIVIIMRICAWKHVPVQYSGSKRMCDKGGAVRDINLLHVTLFPPQPQRTNTNTPTPPTGH